MWVADWFGEGKGWLFVELKLVCLLHTRADGSDETVLCMELQG